MKQRIIIFGAGGRVGAAFCRQILQKYPDWRVVGTARQAQNIPNGAEAQHIDMENIPKHFIQAGDIVVNCTHARFAPYIIAQLGDDTYFYNLGSMRVKSSVVDRKTDNAKNALKLMQEQCPGKWVFLAPTMIYGAKGEAGNIGQLMRILQKTPIIPMPAGSNQYVQPIHYSDVVQFMVALVGQKYTNQGQLPLAGASKLRYYDMIRLVARFIGKKIAILTLPAVFTPIFIAIMAIMGKDSNIIRRLSEDKSISDEEYTNLCTITRHIPMDLWAGLQYDSQDDKQKDIK